MVVFQAILYRRINDPAHEKQLKSSAFVRSIWNSRKRELLQQEFLNLSDGLALSGT